MSQRLLHLIPSLGTGGAERQLAYIAEGLVSRGWEVHIAHIYSGSNRERMARAGALLHPIPASSNYDPRILYNLIRLTRGISPVAVQTWNPMMDVLGPFVAGIARTQWIMTERNMPEFFPPAFKLRLRQSLARQAAAVVSNSRGANDYWRARLPLTTMCRTVPNVLPLTDIGRAPRADPQSLGLPRDRPLILYVGRFEPQKNIDTLIAAFLSALHQTRAVAILCGEGPLRRDAEDTVRRSGMAQRVRFTGFSSNVWGWMKTAAVFISVSYYEGMPNAVMECIGAGCPLVVSDIAAHRELLAIDEAVFVDPRNLDRVTDGIVASLRDPHSALSRSRKAYSRCRHWTLEDASASYEDIIRGVSACSRHSGLRRNDCKGTLGDPRH